MLCKTLAVGMLGANCTILGDEETKKGFVIDPGGDAPQILMALAELELEVIGILHTHGHIDHVGATGELAGTTSAVIYLHEADRFLFETAPQQAAMFGLPEPKMPGIDLPLNDGDTIELGRNKIKVLHTPGHSPGSVSFSIEDEKICICGDTLFFGGIGRTDIWGGSFDTLERSIREQLYTLDGSTRVITGHGPDTKIDRERRANPFVRG